MKTKIWVGILAALVLISAGLSLWLLRPTQAVAVEIWSEGKLVQTLSLTQEQSLTVETESGKNTVTVSAGKVAVTEADCPDHYCMERGWCSGGAQIVCLPNRLVLRFVGQTHVDGVAG